MKARHHATAEELRYRAYCRPEPVSRLYNLIIFAVVIILLAAMANGSPLTF